MGFGVASLFYLLIGLAISSAVFLSGRSSAAGGLPFRLATALLFWPLYLPALLVRPEAGERPHREEAGERDPMGTAISRVEGELASALASLDGWAGGVLTRERERIAELERSWTAQAARIREIDLLLAREDSPGPAEGDPGRPAGPETAPRVQKSEEGRRRNLERLREVRRRAYQDLMATLAWVRELVSMIHLAKFTGAPASRAEELVAQIAAAVEGLSTVSAWEGDPPGPPGSTSSPEGRRRLRS